MSMKENVNREVEMRVEADGKFHITVEIETYGRAELGQDYAKHAAAGLKEFLEVNNNMDLEIAGALKPKSEANASEGCNRECTCALKQGSCSCDVDSEASKILRDIEETSDLELEKVKNACLEGMVECLKSDMRTIVTTGLTLEIQDRWRHNFKMETEMDELLTKGTPEEIAEGFIKHLKESGAKKEKK